MHFRIHKKNETGTTLRLSTNMIGHFPHKLILINRQVSNHYKAIANNLSANLKLSKSSKI